MGWPGLGWLTTGASGGRRTNGEVLKALVWPLQRWSTAAPAGVEWLGLVAWYTGRCQQGAPLA